MNSLKMRDTANIWMHLLAINEGKHLYFATHLYFDNGHLMIYFNGNN